MKVKRFLAPTGATMNREEYLAYLARCRQQWEGMGRPEQAGMVSRMIARVKRMKS